jgi:hypothetical protein
MTCYTQNGQLQVRFFRHIQIREEVALAILVYILKDYTRKNKRGYFQEKTILNDDSGYD